MFDSSRNDVILSDFLCGNWVLYRRRVVVDIFFEGFSDGV